MAWAWGNAAVRSEAAAERVAEAAGAGGGFVAAEFESYGT